MQANAARRAARLMRTLSNGHRLLILSYLQGRDLSVSELNPCLDLSQSVLSQHLAIVRNDGLV